jgi:hypothetical protein
MILHTSQIEWFNTRFETTDTIVLPILTDCQKHPLNNTLSALYVRFLDNDDVIIVPVNHSETLPVDIKFVSNGGTGKRYTINKKSLLHSIPLDNVIDINFLKYVNGYDLDDYSVLDTRAHAFVKQKNRNVHNINRIIPLLKHVEQMDVLSSKMKQTIATYEKNSTLESFVFLNDISTNVLSIIERCGLFVDTSLFKERFGEEQLIHISPENLVYSEYNLYTTTGRPSNRYGGINFAAMNKGDSTREIFTSRFGTDGFLVQFDYDAYHLRLIADLIDYKNLVGNVHEHFGQYYFSTNEKLTQEQYEESKRISFSLLYGGIRPEYMTIPFFKQVDGLIHALWNKFMSEGKINSMIGNKVIRKDVYHDMNPQKLFNYFIQLHETETNMLNLNQTLLLFTNMKSKPVLYTYDSLLIDFCTEDGIELVNTIKNSLESGGKFPTKVFGGKNYHSLVNITNKF